MFPRTTVGGLSLSRMIIGTNWFLGFSHTSVAKDKLITQHVDRKTLAGILEVFLAAGVDTMMGLITRPLLQDAIKDAQDRTGKKLILVSTPGFPTGLDFPTKGWDIFECEKILDAEHKAGSHFCFPHTSCTDNILDKCTRELRHLPALCRMIRDRGMIPGLSTHNPESIVYSDERNYDVATYISIYNAMGFLMPIEVDWVAHIIRNAKKPVMTIKPMAAGHIRPFQAFNFVWNTLRDIDMVTVGTLTADEAKECIELSLSILERRKADVDLQGTRSKASVKPVG